jgi:hypothetical protein
MLNEQQCDEFWAGASQNYYRSKRGLIRARAKVLSEFIALRDEELRDHKGADKEMERVRRSWRPSHVVDGGGVDQSSDPLKCERSYGPSHVDD